MACWFFNTVIQYFIPRDCHYSRNLKVTSVPGAVSQPCCLTGISQHPCLLLYEPLLFTEIIPSVPWLKCHHKYTFPSVLQSPSSARSETSLPFADMSSKKGCFPYILCFPYLHLNRLLNGAIIINIQKHWHDCLNLFNVWVVGLSFDCFYFSITKPQYCRVRFIDNCDPVIP